MSNLTPPVGYPYGPDAPLPSVDVNDLVESVIKAPNADEGSSHAPTADLEWSGAFAGGFRFDTAAPFPFYGYLNVTNNLRFTAPVGGSVRFDSTVALDVLGPVTLKTGFAASLTVESGVTVTMLSSATCTIASGATCNLSGTTNVRGPMIIKSAGGPGSFSAEASTVCTFAGATTYAITHVETWGEGGEINGVVTRKGLEIRSGGSGRTAHRQLNLPDASADIDVSADTWTILATLTGSHTYRVCHSGVAGTKVPRPGERIIVRRGDPAGVSAHNPRVERESGQDLWIWGIGYHGGVILEFNGAQWDVVFGANVNGAALAGTGWYGN